MQFWGTWKQYRSDETWLVDLPKGGDLPCALFFPADYSVGSANLGFHYIFRALKLLGVGAERFFFSPIPNRSVDSDERLDKFSLILTSVSYEGDFERLCSWLIQNNVPLLAEQRDWNTAPLIGAGGATTYINPLLLSGVCDFIVMGDGLPVLPYIVEEVRRWQRDGNKAQLLHRLSLLDNVLVPSIHLPDPHNLTLKIAKSDGMDMGHSAWVTPNSVFGRTMLIELQRGCCRHCSYCTLPNCFGPFRQRGADDICQEISRLSISDDFDQVGLVTPEAGDFPKLEKVLDCLHANQKGVSFASLRADALTPQMIKALIRGGRKSITLAPETGDENFRRKCGKNITNDRFIQSAILAAESGVKQIKLYFMLGLPDELDEHVEQIPLLCEQLYKETRLSLHLSVGQFVPKPGTHWEEKPFLSQSEIRRRQRIITKKMVTSSKSKPTIRFSGHKEALKEYLLTWSGYLDSLSYATHFPEKGGKQKIDINREHLLMTLCDLGLR